MDMKKLMLLAAMLLLTGAPSFAQGVDLTGSWELNVTTGQGPMPTSTMVLKKEGDRIFGTISGERGDIGVEAEMKLQAVAIHGTLQTASGPLAFALIGTVEGNAMKGTVGYGGATQGEWTATRAAQAAPATPPPPAQDKTDVTGTWSFEVTTDYGTGNPTVVFKQDGETVTGQYSGNYGQAALTGTIKGKELTFSYDMATENGTFHVSYAAIVDKDTMKGTMSIADVANGTFTGKKAK
jgi:hypothetical protein